MGAENEEGETSSSVTLPVHYLPASVSVSAPTSASVSSPLLLHCESAASYPSPSLVWRIVDQDQEEVVREEETVLEEQEDGNMVATSNLRLDAGAGLLTAQCIAKVEELGEIASDVMEVSVMDTTTTTTTSTTSTTSQPLGLPIVFGLRPGSVLLPNEEVVLTCSAVVKGEGSLQWMVGNQLRGEGAELHRKDGKLISSWKYMANLDDTSVACIVSGEEQRSTAIELNIKEDFGQETVTLWNMDDDDDEEYGSEEYDEEDYEEEYDEEYEEDAATDKSEEADAIENLSASASLAQEDQMSAFEDSVPVARVQMP